MKDSKLYNKKLVVPQGFDMPTKLKFKELTARPLGRLDLQEDLKAVNSSLRVIRETRGGSWPSEELNEDFDLLDLAWHEREFRDGDSFAYVIELNNKYIGCFYIYPVGTRTPLDETTDQYDADFSWWVTAEAYDLGAYQEAFNALEAWRTELPFKKVLYSNKQIPQGEVI